MEELAKEVQKKYIEDITTRYPIHRFFMLFCILLSSYIYQKKDHARLLCELQKIKIKFVFDFKDGILASIDFNQLLIGIAATAFISFLYSKISSLFFKTFAQSSDFETYISQIENKINSKKSNQQLLNYFISTDISKELKGLRDKIKSYHSQSEILLSLVGCFCWGLRSNNYIDWLIIIALIIMIAHNLWKSFNFYISDFLPYYISEQVLLGSKVKFGDK